MKWIYGTKQHLSRARSSNQSLPPLPLRHPDPDRGHCTTSVKWTILYCPYGHCKEEQTKGSWMVPQWPAVISQIQPLNRLQPGTRSSLLQCLTKYKTHVNWYLSGWPEIETVIGWRGPFSTTHKSARCVCAHYFTRRRLWMAIVIQEGQLWRWFIIQAVIRPSPSLLFSPLCRDSEWKVGKGLIVPLLQRAAKKSWQTTKMDSLSASCRWLCYGCRD